MKTKQVIKILETKDPEQEVQFLVMNVNGGIVAMQLDGEFFDIAKILKAFKPLKKSVKK